MSKEIELLVHARWYFSQASQGTDHRRMQLLAELGLEYLRLAGQHAPPSARALTVNPRESDSSYAVGRSPAGDREAAASHASVRK